MKKLRKLLFAIILTPFFLTACGNKEKPIIPPYKGDVSLLTYDTMTVEYQLPEGVNNITDIESSDESLFTVKNPLIGENKVVIESNLNNKVGTANLNFIDSGTPVFYLKVAVNYPQTMDEAKDAFTLAAMKLTPGKEFSVTFNFKNNYTIEDFELSLEIYDCREIVGYVKYEQGVSCTNRFQVLTNNSYGWVKSTMKPNDGYYAENIDSLNYLSRDIHTSIKQTDTFYIDSVEKTLIVENSEELFWAVEHGYRPIISGSRSAELNNIYNKAKTDFCSYINPSWSNLQKFRELYDRLISYVHYDHSPGLNEGYPYIHSAYYLDGVFSDKGYAVCDGFSKSYALLCGILGLPCIRSYGFPPTGNVGHAWNYVKLNGEWYLVCPTWAKLDIDFGESISDETLADFYGKKVSLTKYDCFLASKNYFKNMGENLSDLAFTSIEKSSSRYSGDIDEIDYYIKSNDDASRIHNKIYTHIGDGTCVCFECSSNVTYATVNNWASKIAGSTSLDWAWAAYYGENNQILFGFVCFKNS